MIVEFQEIQVRRTVKYKCDGCGKYRTKVISDFQTINPFNKNKNGLPKTDVEIEKELRLKVKSMVWSFLKNPKCSNCERLCEKCGKEMYPNLYRGLCYACAHPTEKKGKRKDERD